MTQAFIQLYKHFNKYILNKNNWYPTDTYLGLFKNTPVFSSGTDPVYILTEEMTDINYHRVQLNKSYWSLDNLVTFPGSVPPQPDQYEGRYNNVIEFNGLQSSSYCTGWFITDTPSSTGVLIARGNISTTLLSAGQTPIISGVCIRYTKEFELTVLDQFLIERPCFYLNPPNYWVQSDQKYAVRHILGIQRFPNSPLEARLVDSSFNTISTAYPVYQEGDGVTGSTRYDPLMYVDSSGNPIMWEGISSSTAKAITISASGRMLGIACLSNNGIRVVGSGGGGCNYTWYSSYAQFGKEHGEVAEPSWHMFGMSFFVS